MKKKRGLVLILFIFSILGLIGCDNDGDPYVTKTEAVKILQRKGYTIEEKTSLKLLDGTEATGDFMFAKKGSDFAIIFTLDDEKQSAAVKETIESEYSWNHYIAHYDVIYILTKQSAKDLGLDKCLKMIANECK